MRKFFLQNSIRYYLLIVLILGFLFLSNDFGATDVQKTAIVVAAGIDRQEDTFIVTSQVAIPQSSKQGKSSEAVQIVSRGKTVGEAFEEINAKTGWYPKLVFCDLILFGESAKSADVFASLDFFLRDEYLSDNCKLAVCNGTAKDLLNTTALVDPSSSTAIKKVLSSHAERVGTVLPNTLREFAIGYFSESKCGYLPILATEPQQEKIGKNDNFPSSLDKQNNNEAPPSNKPTASTSSQSPNESDTSQKATDKPVFSARETALFTHGKWVDTLNREETFALAAVLSNLRLASYTLDGNNQACTLNIRRNTPSIKLQTSDSNHFTLKVDLDCTAGMLDYAASQPIEKIGDAGDVPKEFFTIAANKLKGEIESVYEKCRANHCDLFGVRERLIKYGERRFHPQQEVALSNTRVQVSVRFKNVR